MAVAARHWRIGLTGCMASGKGEVVRLLEHLGLRVISLSDIVRREATKTGSAITRKQMQDIGNRLRREGGAGILGKMVRELIKSSEPASWVIDGIRNPAEVAELRKMPGFILVGIESDEKIILARMRQRGRSTDTVAEAELRTALAREWGHGEPEGGQQVGPTMALADFVIANNGSLSELEAGLDRVLKEIGAKHD
ncbi:MAG: dephospho-CoA kinase [Candidatus Aminicenantes bacterium]|nr:dephospho-CoA kinase [Candidatus Aminicenantes bacterium]